MEGGFVGQTEEMSVVESEEMWPEGVGEKKQEKDSLSSVDGDKLSVDWK